MSYQALHQACLYIIRLLIRIQLNTSHKNNYNKSPEKFSNVLFLKDIDIDYLHNAYSRDLLQIFFRAVFWINHCGKIFPPFCSVLIIPNSRLLTVCRLFNNNSNNNTGNNIDNE